MISRNKANTFFLGNCLENAYVTGQGDRLTQILSGQIAILGRTLSGDQPLFWALHPSHTSM